jgi:hypothetical protein
MASWHPRGSGLRAGRSANRLLERAACGRSSRTPVLLGEVPDALLERRVLGGDPLRAVRGPSVYQVADLAHEGRDPVALSADLGASGVHGRLGRHTE